jgi:hypothetical protein
MNEEVRIGGDDPACLTGGAERRLWELDRFES